MKKLGVLLTLLLSTVMAVAGNKWPDPANHCRMTSFRDRPDGEIRWWLPTTYSWGALSGKRIYPSVDATMVGGCGDKVPVHGIRFNPPIGEMPYLHLTPYNYPQCTKCHVPKDQWKYYDDPKGWP